VPPPIKPPPTKGGLQHPEDALVKAQKQKDAIADECTALEVEVEELKVRYEMYFLGVEKREPNKTRDDLKKKVLRIKEAFTRNAALRFRLQSLHARFLAYERMWLRSAREKEEGTYHRDVFKAKMHIELRARREREAQGEAAAATPPPAPAKAPAGAQPKAAAAAAPRQPAAAAPGGGVADRQLRDLYTQYISAKKQCGEDVSRLTFDAVAKSVQRQVPEILTRYNAKSVEFKVVVKDGKATLKAVPKT
jgi:FtsZ-binding cell division protein ZapB